MSNNISKTQFTPIDDKTTSSTNKQILDQKQIIKNLISQQQTTQQTTQQSKTAQLTTSSSVGTIKDKEQTSSEKSNPSAKSSAKSLSEKSSAEKSLSEKSLSEKSSSEKSLLENTNKSFRSTNPESSNFESSNPKFHWARTYFDHFDNGSIDEKYWNTSANVTTADGYVQISDEGQIDTQNKFKISFGKVEARVRMSKNDDSINIFSLKPCSKSLESIEIFKFASKDKNKITSSVRLDKEVKDVQSQTFQFDANTDLRNGFHVFCVDWQADGIKFYVDDLLHCEMKQFSEVLKNDMYLELCSNSTNEKSNIKTEKSNDTLKDKKQGFEIDWIKVCERRQS